VISVSVVCAEEVTTARWLQGSTRLSTLRLRAGRPTTLPSPEEAAERQYSAAEQTVIAEATGSHVVGDPATVIALLDDLVVSIGADELMVTTSTFAHADRLASYELLGRASSDRTGPTSPAGQATSALLDSVPRIGPEQVGHPGRAKQAGDATERLR
jgi:alkanesulfonate monooxygenase SsuD/methylene tetrahydromethanopterin reductase-like flavin-dependent oxidoreductase (luciferase family)